MPSYLYHLRFELYPLPDSDPTKISKREREREIWVPSEGLDIFGGTDKDWPRHKPVAWEQNRTRTAGAGSSTGSVPGSNTAHTIKEGGNQLRGGSNQGLQSGAIKPGGAKGGVIDCGPSRRARPEESDNLIVFGGTKDSQSQVALPSARFVDKKRDLQSSRRDWRFGRIRVESLDMDGVKGHHGRGEGSQGGIVPMNAGLEPGGRVTKARFEEIHNRGANGLELNNTEVGWGVVHLYRDGEETPGLMGVEVYNADAAANPANKKYSNGSSEMDEDQDNADDCTILCIPAVPSYLTSRDFLGWVGEKTMHEVSHFRMVMTGRLNRYMVLMKFRDGHVARRWKPEWDGKVFNSMEVCFHLDPR